jgi:DNA-binding transcriptional LysR family regulator
MDVEVFHHFITLVRFQNYSKAAQQLHVSQPTLSRNISLLEKALGQKLVMRERPLRLTPAGNLALEQAEEIWYSYEKLRVLMRSLDKKFSGTVRVHDISYFPQGLNLLAVTTSLLKEGYPNIDVKLIRNISETVPSLLNESKLDIGFIFEIDGQSSSDFDSKTFAKLPIGGYTNTLCIGLEKENPLLLQEPLRLIDFKEMRFMRPAGAFYDGPYSVFSQFCESLGFTPKYELVCIESLLEFYMHDLNDNALLFTHSMIDQMILPASKIAKLVFPQIVDTDLSLRLLLVHRKDSIDPRVRVFVEQFNRASASIVDTSGGG